MSRAYPEEKEFQLEFKRRLKRYRENRFNPDGSKWSQTQMANALGVKVNTYAKYEQLSQTKNNFPMFLLPRLAEILKRDTWEVLTEQSSMDSPDKRDQA